MPGREPTSDNCAVAGSGRWRGLHPTFGPSGRVLAHALRQASGSATAYSLCVMPFYIDMR